MRSIYLSLLGLISFFISCDTNKECCLPIKNGELLGTYQVYEYGYSPGDRYIIEEVPAEPAQLLYFNTDNTFSSNYTGLEDFTYYVLLADDKEGLLLALFNEEPDLNEPLDLHNLKHSYIVEFDKLNVKLYYRFCREGCHIGLQKVE